VAGHRKRNEHKKRETWAICEELIITLSPHHPVSPVAMLFYWLYALIWRNRLSQHTHHTENRKARQASIFFLFSITAPKASSKRVVGSQGVGGLQSAIILGIFGRLDKMDV